MREVTGCVLGGDGVPALVAPALASVVAGRGTDQVAVGGDIGLGGDPLFPPGDRLGEAAGRAGMAGGEPPQPGDLSGGLGQV